MAEKTGTEVQELKLTGRTELYISGVLTLDDYSETSVNAGTSAGYLTVEGEGLHVRRLTPEDRTLYVDGRITGIYYSDEPDDGKHGFFSRLFR